MLIRLISLVVLLCCVIANAFAGGSDIGNSSSNAFTFGPEVFTGMGTSFSGDVATRAGQSLSGAAVPPSVGAEVSFEHVFASHYIIGADVSINPLSVSRALATGGGATYSANFHLAQLETAMLFGREFRISSYLAMKPVLMLGVFYYSMTGGQAYSAGVPYSYQKYSNIAMSYGFEMQWEIGDWKTGVHPMWTFGYFRSTPMTLAEKVSNGVVTATTVKLNNKPEMTESIITTGFGFMFNA